MESAVFLSSFISIEFSVQRVLGICPNKVVWTQAAMLAKPSVDTKTMLAKVMP